MRYLRWRGGNFPEMWQPFQPSSCTKPLCDKCTWNKGVQEWLNIHAPAFLEYSRREPYFSWRRSFFTSKKHGVGVRERTSMYVTPVWVFINPFTTCKQQRRGAKHYIGNTDRNFVLVESIMNEWINLVKKQSWRDRKEHTATLLTVSEVTSFPSQRELLLSQISLLLHQHHCKF